VIDGLAQALLQLEQAIAVVLHSALSATFKKVPHQSQIFTGY
jgi:hypothetical protein